MIVNGFTLLGMEPIKNMESKKVVAHGMTYGLGEAGYDVRIKQDIVLGKWSGFRSINFALASTIEEFQMPTTLLGRVCDKSSWARKGLSVFNTVIEPGWCGFLTLELVYHGGGELLIPAGAPIAQVLFEEVLHAASYDGRYQNQEDAPVKMISAKQ